MGFFLNVDFPSCIFATFSGQFCFWRNYFFTLFQSNYFNTTVTFSKQLFLQSISASFEELFFRTVTSSQQLFFSEQLLFQSETSTEQPPLENRKLFRIVTFWNSNLFGGDIVWNNDIYRRVTFSK